jgi:transposase
MTVRPILCGKCHVPVEGRVDEDGNRTVTCPNCGEHDTLENAAREAVKKVASETLRNALGPAGVSRRGAITITVKHPADGQFRFIFGEPD